MQDYAARLRIPVEGSTMMRLYTETGVLFSVGYRRVVIGGRGPYIEFERSQIVCQLQEVHPSSHYYYSQPPLPKGRGLKESKAMRTRETKRLTRQGGSVPPTEPAARGRASDMRGAPLAPLPSAGRCRSGAYTRPLRAFFLR
ncbi:MAG: hypothetical protein WC683_02940 [bacterium]